ncbi:tudor domain-containing protein 7A-like isoform X1 [Frankliniella occidentalis]|uniref:Tudor domain-containing protein 7A-like isoform X1 n=1 Tax=Frankliniella occidentalis TaxID=133901 RepID=A0A6J1TCH5_FRAOC|nr:tudor domain-containing protein 7A-like isoform X1 [Frankliniella occidentalis]
MSEDLEELKINISAVLTSGGGQLTERKFLSDYRSLIGTIQFSDYGHRSLKSLIQSLGGFYYTRNAFGEDCINAGYDEKTAHISSLIARQRKKPGTVKSKRYARSRLPPRPMLRRPTSAPTSYRPPATSRPPRSAPPPRYGNPPIIPQRQPISSPRSESKHPPVISQRQPLQASQPESGYPPIIPQRQPLPLPKKPSTSPAAGTKAQDRLSRGLDVEVAQSKILSVPVTDANTSSKGQSSSKVSTSVGEAAEDTSFVDIQWLQGRVLSNNGCRLKSARKEQALVSGDAQLASQQCSNPNPVLVNGTTSSAISYPALVNGMTNGAASYPALVNGTNGLSSRNLVNAMTTRPCLPAVVNGVTNGILSSPPFLNEMTALTNPSLSSQAGPVPLMSISVNVPSFQSKQTPSPTRPRGRLSQQQVVFKSYVEELSHLTSTLGLGNPTYKYVERKPTRKQAVFIAKLKIGETLLYSSYPDEKPTCEEAQEFVAKLACDDLRQRPREAEDLDDDKVIERVFNIVQSKANGMVESGIVKEYESIYSSSLPISWLEVIGASPRFEVEQPLNGRGNAIIYPNLCVQEDQPPISSIPEMTTLPEARAITVSRPEPLHVNGATPSSLNNFSRQKPFKDINANTVPCGDSSIVRELPKLVLPKPKEGTWDVFVASVSSTENELWVRFIGDEYDAKYNDLMTDLEIKMFSSSEPVQNPVVDQFYCCKFDNNWLRVQLKEILKKTDGSEDEAVVFLIDNGEMDNVSLSELRVIDEEYLRLPGQAVPVVLAYVDVTYEAAQIYLMNNVIGSSFVAEIIKHSEELPKVVLYNTENEGEALNINSCILDSIIQSLDKPQLVQGLNFLRISHVQKETRPFVQIKGKDLFFLESILNDISLIDLVAVHGVNAHPRLVVDSRQMFLVRSKRCPNTWLRANIVDSTTNQRTFVMHFCDHGFTERVLLSDIFDLKKVLQPLCKFPVQAVQFNLADLNESQLNSGVVKRLTELAPPDQFVIGKVDQGSGDLKLFKRIQPDNLIFSINGDLIFSYEELKNTPDIEEEDQADATAACGTQDVSTNPLAIYQLPVDVEFFNVHVTMSSNPFNFVVQPVVELPSFNAMMASMQEYYEATHHIMSTPAIEELVENRAFAAKHPEDLQWYRVSIVATLNQGVVSVRYADYGDVGLVALDRIRFLEERFKQIPALAIRAKLHGVKPLNIDWSVEECLFFNNLVEENSFPTIIREINQNVTAANSWRVSLSVIDTSNENEDIDIGDHLIQNEYAGKA